MNPIDQIKAKLWAENTQNIDSYRLNDDSSLNISTYKKYIELWIEDNIPFKLKNVDGSIGFRYLKSFDNFPEYISGQCVIKFSNISCTSKIPLKRIGRRLEIRYDESLEEIDTFPELTQQTETIIIGDCNLKSIKGLPKDLGFVHLNLENNPNLKVLDCPCEKIESLIIINCPIESFGNIKRIGKLFFSVDDWCDTIGKLDLLKNIDVYGEHLSIYSNCSDKEINDVIKKKLYDAFPYKKNYIYFNREEETKNSDH